MEFITPKFSELGDLLDVLLVPMSDMFLQKEIFFCSPVFFFKLLIFSFTIM